MTTLAEAFKAHYLHEGWHAVYKKYGSEILSRGNYRWKRKIRKRFGECRKCAFYAELHTKGVIHAIAKRRSEEFLAAELDRPQHLLNGPWTGQAIPIIFATKE